MGQIHKDVKRGRGRPPIRSDAATRRLIIDAASQEFQANGYAGTCVEAVAQRAALEHILIAYGALALDAETIAINRLVIAESDRFPEIAVAFYETALVQTNRAMESWLRRQCKRGSIRLKDPHAASGMLRGMMVMEPQRAVMLGQRAVPNAEEIANRARDASQLFLNGCRA